MLLCSKIQEQTAILYSHLLVSLFSVCLFVFVMNESPVVPTMFKLQLTSSDITYYHKFDRPSFHYQQASCLLLQKVPLKHWILSKFKRKRPCIYLKFELCMAVICTYVCTFLEIIQSKALTFGLQLKLGGREGRTGKAILCNTSYLLFLTGIPCGCHVLEYLKKIQGAGVLKEEVEYLSHVIDVTVATSLYRVYSRTPDIPTFT